LTTKNIAIFLPSSIQVSESFIEAHIAKLPFQIYTYHSGRPPLKLNDSEYILKKNGINTVKYIAKKTLCCKSLKFNEYALFQSLKKNKIHVALVEYGITGVAIVQIIRKLKIPLIIHFHGYDAYHFDLLANSKSKYRELFEYASSIIGVSTDMVVQLEKIGAPSNKIIYNPYGPKEIFFELSPNYHSDHILALGRFVDKKAPYYLVEVLKNITNKYPNIRLDFIGDGPLLPLCKNLAKLYGIEHAINFLGALPHEEVMNYFKRAFAFVQHSITAENGDKEGTPVAVLEASAAGLPVIATRHAGIQDVIVENETGYLVNEHDVEGMINKLSLIIDDRKKCEEMGKAGRLRVRQNYSMEKHIHTITEIIENITSNKN